MMARVIVGLAAVVLLATPARAQLGDLGKRLGFGHSKALSEDKIASGMRGIGAWILGRNPQGTDPRR